MKCGTSALYQALLAHPEVGGPPGKELDFFVREGTWSRGTHWYRSQFPATMPVWCEASPNYTTAPYLAGVPERAKAMFPHALLLYIVRDPVDRLVSHYLHLVAAQQEERGFQEIVDRLHLEHGDLVNRRSSGFAADFFPDLLPNQRFQGYLARSSYMYQAGCWLKHFDRRHLLVLTQDELINDPPGAMGRVGAFVDLNLEATAGKHHVTADKRQLTRIGKAIRRSPAGRRLRESRLRDPLHKAARLLLYDTLPSITVTDSQRSYIESLLGEDTAAFQQEFGVVLKRTSGSSVGGSAQASPR